MAKFEISMQHTEKSFESLAHMQYDLFCQSNRVSRTALSVVCIAAGILNFSQWWGILAAAYGCYLTTSTYSSPNHTAHKLAAQIQKSGMPFPSSKYVFNENAMDIFTLPEGKKDNALPYSDVLRLAEDREYFYIFRDRFGGYMIPKADLGEAAPEFKSFLEEKTGLSFRRRDIPAVRFAKWVKQHTKKGKG